MIITMENSLKANGSCIKHKNLELKDKVVIWNCPHCNPEMDTNNGQFTILRQDQLALHIIFYNSIQLISRRLNKNPLYIKLTNFTYTDGREVWMGDESFSEFENEYPMEIAVMDDTDYNFHVQEKFGRVMKNNEFYIFRSFLPMENINSGIGVRIDMYIKVGDEFQKIAFCFLFPFDSQLSEGSISTPFISEIGKIVAKINADFFIIRPFSKSNIDLIKNRHQISWQLKSTGYDIGHRGTGCSCRQVDFQKVFENTVGAFNYASKKGADMVELDVQLTKDKIPVVYHDYKVKIIMEKDGKKLDPLTMDIKDLTLNQLQQLRIKPQREECDYDFEQPEIETRTFPRLKTVLELVDPKCGFNVEIKFPQKKMGGNWESDRPNFDLNEYVDIILEELLMYGGDRRIIISSFHAEICTLIKYKQNRYPILFLNQGATERYVKYANPVNNSVKMATYMAACLDFYGIAAHAEDIIKDISLVNFVRSKMLVLFCWGNDLDDYNVINKLKKAGINGAIYDKIDLLIKKNEEPVWYTDCPIKPKSPALRH